MNCSDFAEVYKAQNCYSPEGSYPVVVKISRGDNEAANAQLEREKAALARVKHMNVVNLLDAGVSPSFLVLEYVPGYNLRSEIPACHFGHDPVHEILNPRQSAMRKPPSWRRTRCIMLQTSIALAAAHAVNVYHCDIKPENLLIYGEKETHW